MECYLAHEDLAVALLAQGLSVEETIQIMQKQMKTSEAICALIRIGIPLQETAWAEYVQEPQL